MKDNSIIQLKKLLLEKLKLSRQAIEKRRDKIKIEYGPFTDLEAYAVLCQINGIDSIKYLDSNSAINVRDACIKIRNRNRKIDSTEIKDSSKKCRNNAQSMKIIKIGECLELRDPLLPQKILNDAKDMTYLYAIVYVFENSVREVIKIIMTKKFGKDWWDYLLTPKAMKMKKNANNRIQDEKINAWHGKRGNHPIYYTDLDDFYDFIDEYWPDFKNIFQDKSWVKTRIKEISRSRNTIDHHNPLASKDGTRVKIYCDDWFLQIDANKEKFIMEEK